MAMLDAARPFASSRERHPNSNSHSDANREPNSQITSRYPHGRSDSGAQGNAKSGVSGTAACQRFISHMHFPRVWMARVCHKQFEPSPSLQATSSRVSGKPTRKGWPAPRTLLAGSRSSPLTQAAASERERTNLLLSERASGKEPY